MKMSSFMLGSLLGAAAMVYAIRKKPGMVTLVATAMTDAGSALFNKSMSRMGVSGTEAKGASSKRTEGSAANSSAAWEEIEAVVNEDPALKSEVNKIMSERSTVSH